MVYLKVAFRPEEALANISCGHRGKNVLLHISFIHSSYWSSTERTKETFCFDSIFCSNHNNQFNVANTDKHSWPQRLERTSWWLNTIKTGVRFVQSSYPTVWQAFPTNTHHKPLESCCCSRLFFIQSVAPHRSPLGSPLIELVFLLAFSSSQQDQLSDWRSYLSTYYIQAF